jgi:hypothetical protein
MKNAKIEKIDGEKRCIELVMGTTQVLTERMIDIRIARAKEELAWLEDCRKKIADEAEKIATERKDDCI